MTTVIPATTSTSGTAIPVTTPRHDFQLAFVDGCWDKQNITIEYRYDLDPKGNIAYLNWSVSGREMSPPLDALNRTAVIPSIALEKTVRPHSFCPV